AEALGGERRAARIERLREAQRRAGEADLAAAELAHPAAAPQLGVHVLLVGRRIAPLMPCQRLLRQLAEARHHGVEVTLDLDAHLRLVGALLAHHFDAVALRVHAQPTDMDRRVDRLPRPIDLDLAADLEKQAVYASIHIRRLRVNAER